MIEKLKKTISFIKIIELFLPFLAVLYFVIWCLRIFNEPLFLEINAYFYVIPEIIDKICYIQRDMYGIDVSMGYVLTSALFIILVFILRKIENEIDKRMHLEMGFESKKIYQEQKIIKEQKAKERSMDVNKLNVFFGLLELKLTYYDHSNKNENDLIKLKIEYSKMIAAKLLEKYPDLELDSSDKLFMVCDNFSKFNTIVKDTVKLFEVFNSVGKKKFIQTDLLLSFWADNESANLKNVFKILLKINQLNYVNKVILSGGTYFRYQKEKEKCFDFSPLGVSKLLAVLENEDDLDINLFSIKNSKKYDILQTGDI